MRRLLKDTGSIYLHCDPTASHYLKLLMDAIFRKTNFKNEVVWKRTESHNTAERYGNIADTLLYYVKSEESTWNQLHTPYSEAQLKRFRHVDKSGRRYKTDDLTAPRPDSESGKFEWRGTMPGKTRGWGYTIEQLEEWWEQGRIHTKRDGTPRMDGLRVYLDETQGKPLQSIWTDIPRIPNTSSERLSFPTQKPLVLLDRIIEASSNKDDVVFDPFCGCATTMVSADSLGRKWVGCDLSPKAVELVVNRIKKAKGLWGEIVARETLPRRTDKGDELNVAGRREYKQTLYGNNGGCCEGCGMHYMPSILEMDHIIPKSKGGTDHADNFQLLCGPCNKLKRDRSHAHLVAELSRRLTVTWS